MNCAAPGRIGYSQHLADATSIEKMQKWGENKKKQKNPPPKTKKTHHRWKNYLPDIENSFCYMNPDMCYPIKGRRVRWGGKERKLEEENIIRKNSLNCFSPVFSGQGVWGRRWDVCADDDKTGPSAEHQGLFPRNIYKKDGGFSQAGGFLFADLYCNEIVCCSLENQGPAQLGMKESLIMGHDLCAQLMLTQTNRLLAG